MKNKAISALIELGITASSKGFDYIVDTMCLFEKDEWRKGKTTDLYAELARMHDATTSRVERAIRHAFSIAKRNASDATIEKYLSAGNWKNGNLLAVLYFRLSMEE